MLVLSIMKKNVFKSLENACQYLHYPAKLVERFLVFLQLEKSFTYGSKEMTHGTCTEKWIEINQMLLKADRCQSSVNIADSRASGVFL